MRSRRSVAAAPAFLATALAVAGCGSLPVSRLPPPAGPAAPATVTAAGGRLRVVLDPRARTVELYAGARHLGTQPAGVGPTGIASNDLYRAYVADAGADGLLVYRLRPDFELERRLRLRGEPFAVAADPARKRLYVTLRARGLVAELPLHGRPHVLRAFATAPRPDRLAVRRDGDLLVSGRGGERTLIDPRTAAPTR